LHRLNESKTKRIPIEINFLDNFGGPVPCISIPSQNPDYDSYLAIISGETLSAIYQNYGSRLLEQNVRSFLQFSGKINKGIRETIVKEPHMFLAFNNGIAATAQSVDIVDLPDGGKAITVMNDLQIVNGGQTTASIFHTKRKNKEADVSKIFVQMKLSVIRDIDNFSNIVSRISKYANTQNKVSEADLTSNNPFHIEIEKLSRTIWASPASGHSNQTRWFYERARGQYKDALNREGYSPAKQRAFALKNPKTQMLTKEDIGKFILSWDMQPWSVVRGRQKNYVEFMKSVKNIKPDNTYFEDMISKAILFQTAEKIYGVKPNSIGDMRYITVPYAIAYISYKIGVEMDLYKIWKNQAVSEPLRLILKSLMVKIDPFMKKHAPGSLYGEWAKKEDCWNKLKENDFGIDFSKLSGDFADPKSQEKRHKRTENETLAVLRQANVDYLTSFPSLLWKEIEKWGRISGKLDQYHTDIAGKISVIINKKGEFSDIQLERGGNIIETVLEFSPELLIKSEDFEDSKNDKIQITIELVSKVVAWDKRHRKLKDIEYKFMAGLAEGKTAFTDRNKQIAGWNLEKAKRYGFIE